MLPFVLAYLVTALTAAPGNLTDVAPDMSLWRDVLTHQRRGQRTEVHLTSAE